MFLSYFDLFQLPIIFFFSGRSRRSSNLGLLCSMGIYIFLLLSFFQSDLFAKKSPIVINQSLETPHANKIQFDNTTLILFSVSDASNSRYIDPTIFTVEFKYYHVKSNGFSVNEYVSQETRELKPCSIEDVSFNSSIYEIMGLKNAFCLNNKIFDIEGFWDELELKYISVNLNICNNLTSNNTCKPKEQINEFWTKPYKFFVTEFHSAQIDVYDYQNPLKVNYQVDYQFVDPLINKRFNIHLKNAEVETDDGWIFPQNSIKSDIMFASIEFDFQSRIDESPPIFQMLFYASKEKVLCSRRYQKLPETLGSLTGMTHLIMFSCILATKLVTHVKTLKKILNKLYVFPKHLRKKSKKTKKLKTLNENSLKSSKNETLSNKEKTQIFTLEMPKNEIHSINSDHKSNKKISQIFESKQKDDVLTSKENKMEDNLRFQTLILEENSKNQIFTLEMQKNESESITIDKKSNQNIDSQILECKEKKEDFKKIEDNLKIQEQVGLKHDSFVLEHFSQNSIGNRNNEMYEVKKNVQKEQNVNENSRSKKKKKTTFLRFFSKTDKSDRITEKNKLQLSSFEYLWYHLCKIMRFKKTYKQKIIYEAENTFKAELDIVNILTKLHDLEKLKMILLNEDQLILFNCLAKPSISLNDQDIHENMKDTAQIKMMKIRRISEKFKDHSNKIQDSYNKILNEKENGIINQRLIELIDETKHK